MPLEEMTSVAPAIHPELLPRDDCPESASPVHPAGAGHDRLQQSALIASHRLGAFAKVASATGLWPNRSKHLVGAPILPFELFLCRSVRYLSEGLRNRVGRHRWSPSDYVTICRRVGDGDTKR